ncbi:hypothetical protein TNIN_178551 [Trichonephila inaurata madagascariensis]|uniref:Uncharacterized protein n=1 Tax=Trichonephila inaurata madagascariensis TaxID=2747483 RepID=A0A8X6X0E4_9ARAC|nr:hypothetical protein TNIN_178551 [Trichonephila inaurata madagascariensis]
MEGRKRREWSSDSFSGSVKEIKRVVQKKPRPSQTTKTTTSAETDKKKNHNPRPVRAEIDFLDILDSGKEKPPSKPELLTKRKFAFPKYLPRQGKSYDGSSVKRPRATVENFESGKSTSNPEFPPVLRGICPEASIGIVQEQPASKPEHSRVRKGRSKIPKIASGQQKYPSKPELVMKRTLPFPKNLPRQEKSSYDGSPLKRPRMTAKKFDSGKSPSRREFSPVVRGKSKIPHLSSGQQQPASKPEHSRVRQGRSKIPTGILASGVERSQSKPEHHDEVHLDLGENSMPIVKKKGNRMTVSGKK